MTSKDEYLVNYLYVDQNDPNIQQYIYQKREFHQHKAKERVDLDDIEAVKKVRQQDNAAGGFFNHQYIVKNFINPKTPYRSLLMFHGLGTGKTCTAIAVAEQFKEQVQKYDTKIYILMSGPIIRKQWMDELIKCGSGYIDPSLKNTQLLPKQREEALTKVFQYYNLMSYKKFQLRVVGQKIKNDENVIDQRFIISNKIHNLDNTLLIVDEAHSILGNEYGNAVMKIIESSINLKILLLTATPMKNLANEVVPLLNMLRPIGQQIKNDELFTNENNYKVTMKPGAEQKIKDYARGYVSYVKGDDPIFFAKKNDKGQLTKNLKFTKVVTVKFEKFQGTQYWKADEASEGDSLDKKLMSVSMFSLPYFNVQTGTLETQHNIDGIDKIMQQVEQDEELLNKHINKMLETKNVAYLIKKQKMLSGQLFNIKYLRNFSCKMHQCLLDLEKMVIQNKGPGLGFVYTNLVMNGVKLFELVLLNNGYIEYQQDKSKYVLENNTKCYYCGLEYKQHLDYNRQKTSVANNKTDKIDKNALEIFEKYDHVFYPATFLLVTGTIEGEENESDNNFQAINEVFNTRKNMQGQLIKFILGTKVINEGISLFNIKQIHILDTYFNMSRLDQAIARGIRNKSHQALISNDNMFPEVDVYKYITYDENKMTIDESWYQKAELKHIEVKKVERLLKEVSFDCPLNYNINLFKDDLKAHKGCQPEQTCPVQCEYMDCQFKCDSKPLNAEFYDNTRQIYKNIEKAHQDQKTYTLEMQQQYIDIAMKYIKDLFVFSNIYQLKTIIHNVKQQFKQNGFENVYDVFYIFKALDNLIPYNNDATNSIKLDFQNFVYNMYNQKGFITVKNDFYYFKHVNIDNKNADQYIDQRNQHVMNLFHYMKKHNIINAVTKQQQFTLLDQQELFQYYKNRPEVKDLVGIIEKNKNDYVFKFKTEGQSQIVGGTCTTTKTREQLVEYYQKLIGPVSSSVLKNELCDNIQDKLIELEKHQIKNKQTFIYVEYDHPIIPPINLDDKANIIVQKLLEAGISASQELKNKQRIVTADTQQTNQLMKNLNFQKVGDKFQLILQ